MSLESIRPILIKSKSDLSLEKFHEKVNVIFHDVESEVYDAVHDDMWDNLAPQYGLIVDSIPHDFKSSKNIVLVDVGCGTGLATEMLLKAGMLDFVSEVVLVDLSPKMMEKAVARIEKLGIKYRTHLGDLGNLQIQADMVMMSSLMHHIPDLADFLDSVSKLLKPNGILFHIHDPNGDYLLDSEYLERKREVDSLGTPLTTKQRLLHNQWVRDIIHRLNRVLGRKNHIDKVNDVLIKEGVIKKHLLAEEIWSITDIHVEDLPYSTNKGISLRELQHILRDFSLLQHRSYGFYGKLHSELPEKLREIEKMLTQSNAKNGRYLVGLWKKDQ